MIKPELLLPGSVIPYNYYAHVREKTAAWERHYIVKLERKGLFEWKFKTAGSVYDITIQCATTNCALFAFGSVSCLAGKCSINTKR